ncbi:MAG: monovalent cation/H(+) antiporter subunit G [Azonexus sp.]|jgi:multicomponent K+:H+ antiporter subunit G|uniref:monovalent cation/H(+) antiporter subunit G n=1 Tax=Azonexus sp. TaxID=1872668 RepID=UPI00283A2685|nr:monovalent cation/H(+) antiporter subunit G [Azonexus sp.]MDR0776434.1 monovalent cation/H(+) antiporter subunit G [Azonexus sp.]
MNIVPMSPWLALPAAILLIAGGLLALIGSLGLLRLNSFYARIHAPTMGNTLGAGCVLIASMLTSSAAAGRPVIHELLITVFLLITSPVTTMLLMRAAVFRSETGRDRQGEEAS